MSNHSSLMYSPSDEYNTQIYELLLHFLTTNDHIFNTVDNNSTQTVLDSIISIILNDKIIDKLKYLEQDLNIYFDPSDKENFDKYNRLYQICNNITDYKKKKHVSLDNYDTERGDFSDVDIIDEDIQDRFIDIAEPKEEEDDELLDNDTNDSSIDFLPETIDKINTDNVHKFITTLFKLDPNEVEKNVNLSNKIIELILVSNDSDDLAKKLHSFINITKLRLIPKLLNYKDIIYYGLRYYRSINDEDKSNIIDEIKEDSILHILPNEYKLSKRKLSDSEFTNTNAKKQKKNSKLLNINKFKLPLDDSELMEKQEIKLPENSYKIKKDGYTELHIPAPEKIDTNFRLIEIKDLPEWSQKVFPSKETSSLNRIQSEVFPTVFHTNKNVLVCAPTGAGKTNIAMLSALQTISKHISNEKKGIIDTNDTSFKMVYIAPLRALVQEQVLEFQRRLSVLGIKVVELTGDSDTSRRELENAHLIISTPEKWDIISRKFHNQNLIQKVELMILDEVHLLHEERGPIIEAISMRMLKNKSRIVALSATLPNFQDVADFLKVDKTGLFFFTPNFRPCPLKQEFISVNSFSSVKELININKACYDKVKESLLNNHQVIVFVHSRKDTLKTAQYLLQQMKKDDEMKAYLNPEDSSIKNILSKEAKENCDDAQLANMIKNGIALHHAGFSRNDRSQSEDLFADGVIKLLVSTKTISWGVNLPAHTVVIKGTDIYSPALNKLVKLSIQDMLQMLGRAGRPRYDTFGEGIIITNKDGVNHYLSLLMDQQNIESRFMDKIIDLTNAEICSGNITNKASLISWAKSSYWFVRMMKNKKLYKTEGLNIDVFLNSLADTIINSLMNANMLVFHDEDVFTSTELANIASDFYIPCSSVYEYQNNLNDKMTLIEILSLFSRSKEFENMIVRPEEKYEMKILLSKLPVPVKESLDDIGCKPNVLLQSFISRLPMDGLSLNADMVFIKQNSTRLIQAIFQISKMNKLSRVSDLILNILLYVEKRVWITETPLRQLDLQPDVLKQIERSNIEWDQILEKDSDDVLDAFYEMAPHLKQFESQLDEALIKFPRLTDIKVSVQTITKTFYRINVLFTPDFKWDHKIHYSYINFFLFLNDYNGDKVLYETNFKVKKYHLQNEVSLSFDIELLYANLPPNLFVSFKAEKWLHCEYKVPVMFMNKIKQIESSLPQPTEVEVDFNSKKKKSFIKEVEKLNIPEFSNIVKNDVSFIEGSTRKHCNLFENEALQIVLKTDENLLYCSTMMESKVMLTKMAFLKAYEKGISRIVYVNDDAFILNEIADWLEKHYPHDNELKISKLGDDLDNKFLFNKSHITLSSFKNFELITREWKNLPNIKEIGYFIADNIETVFDANDLDRGYLFEELISRMSLLQTQFDDIKTRFLCFSDPLSNYYEVGEWIGIERDNCFCYNNDSFIKEMNVEIEFLKYTNTNVVDLMTDHAIVKLLTNQSSSKSKKKADVIYTTSRNESLNIAESVLKKSLTMKTNVDFEKIGGVSDELLGMFTDTEIARYFSYGIFIYYESMDTDDQMILKKFSRACKLYLTDGFFIFKTNAAFIVKTVKVIESDNSLTNQSIKPHLLTKILSSCERDAKLTIMSNEYSQIHKILTSSQYSVESSLPYHFAETLINEIKSGVVSSKSDVLEWLPYTFLNSRLHKNPSYYGVSDNSVFKLSKFITALLNQSLSELEDMEMLSYEEEDSFQLNGAADGVYKYGLSFDDLQLLKENFFAIKSDIQLLQLLTSLPSLEKDLSICYQDSFQQAQRHLGSFQALKQYRDKMPPLSFKIFGLLYFLLFDINSSVLPLTLQLDAKAVYKNLLTLSFKIFKFLVVLIQNEQQQRIKFSVLKGVCNLAKGLHLEIGTFKKEFNVSDSLKQIPYIDEDKIIQLESEGVTTVENIIRNDLQGKVNDEEDEDVDDFFAKFPLATIKDISLNSDDDYIIEISDFVSATEEDGINYTGDYYCIFYTEREEDIYHAEIINQGEQSLKVNKSKLPTDETILVELINDSFITERQLKKIYT